MDATVEQKLRTITAKIYGAGEIDFTPAALAQIEMCESWNLAGLPICVAKTPLSLTSDQQVMGRPQGFRVSVREVKPAAGAGFLIAYLGDIQTMPGLPSHPAANDIDVDADGRINGLD